MPPVTPPTHSSPALAPRPQALRAPPAGLLASFAALLAGSPRRPAAASPSALSRPISPAPGLAAPPAASPGASPGAARRSDRPGREGPAKVDRGVGISLDPLDPLDRALLAQRPPLLSPLAAPAAPATPPAPLTAASPLDQLVERLLRRVALGGSRDRGVAVLRVGAGPLDGAQLTITAEGRSVRVEVSGAAGAEAEAWRSRIEERLRRRGLEATVEVT